MSDRADEAPPQDDPVILRLDEVRALLVLIARIERHLTTTGSTLEQDLHGIGAGEITGGLPDKPGHAAAPEITDADTAHKYLQALRARLKGAQGFQQLFAQNP